jgi:probable rRNA maturation factor
MKVAPAAGAPSSSATVALVTDGRIRALNRDFRGLDKPTDVLSFRSARKGSSRGYLGDIVISVETAMRQARRRRSTLRRELEVLTLHGFLHLLGYDHETDDGEMRRIEYRLRRRFRITGRLLADASAAGASGASPAGRKRPKAAGILPSEKPRRSPATSRTFGGSPMRTIRPSSPSDERGERAERRARRALRKALR